MVKMNTEEIEKQLFLDNEKKESQTIFVDTIEDKPLRGELPATTYPLIEGCIDDDFTFEQESNKYTWLDKLKGLAPIYAIDRHRLSTDGKGVTTLVAFHKCLLRCKYCFNNRTWQTENVSLKMTPKELYEKVKKDNLYFQTTEGGITFGGGESALYSDFITRFRKTCNPKWKLTIETSLWVQQSHIKKLLSVIDYWIIDIKDMDNNRYRQYTGCDNSLMIKNLKFLLEKGKAEQMLVRVPYIQGFNTKENVEENIWVLREMGVVNIECFYYITDPFESQNKNKLLGCLLED